jgi:hypothetical protein
MKSEGAPMRPAASYIIKLKESKEQGGAGDGERERERERERRWEGYDG